MFNPNTLYCNELGYYGNAQFKNNYWLNVNGRYDTDVYDYYEPRVSGRFYKRPREYSFNINLSTDERKPLNFYFHYGHGGQPSVSQYSNFGDFQTTLRIGKRFQLSYMISFYNSTNEKGFVDKNSANDSIIFARRNVNSLENVFSTSYILSNKASLSLRARHYWSGANNKSFYLLQSDGSLTDNPSYNESKDQNYNAFTVDMSFRWNFAPGSELICAWKNSAYADQNVFNNNYWNNLHNTWLNQKNSISLKVLYYIDYNKFRKKKTA